MRPRGCAFRERQFRTIQAARRRTSRPGRRWNGAHHGALMRTAEHHSVSIVERCLGHQLRIQFGLPADGHFGAVANGMPISLAQAGMNLYGQDMDESTTPLETGARWDGGPKNDAGSSSGRRRAKAPAGCATRSGWYYRQSILRGNQK